MFVFNIYFPSSRKRTQRKGNQRFLHGGDSEHASLHHPFVFSSSLSHGSMVFVKLACWPLVVLPTWCDSRVMGGTETPSRDEQADDRTLVHSLEHSKGFGGDWHPLCDTHTCRRKLAHGKTNFSRVRNFDLNTWRFDFLVLDLTQRKKGEQWTSSTDNQVSSTHRRPHLIF